MLNKFSVAAVGLLAILAQGKEHGAHNKRHHHWPHPTGGLPGHFRPPPFPTGSGAPGPFPTAGPTGTGGPGHGGYDGHGGHGPHNGHGGHEGKGNGLDEGSGEDDGPTTVTYTVGSGDHKTVITTTIYHTRTHTREHIIYAEETGKAESGSENEVEAQEKVKKPHTIHRTVTSVEYIYPGASGEASPAEDKHKEQSGPGAGNCPAQVTVTVTAPLKTVTVTASAPGGGEGGEGGEGGPSAGNTNGAATPVPPYPSKSKTKSKCASTGFITKHSSGFNPHPTASGTGYAYAKRGMNENDVRYKH